MMKKAMSIGSLGLLSSAAFLIYNEALAMEDRRWVMIKKLAFKADGGAMAQMGSESERMGLAMAELGGIGAQGSSEAMEARREHGLRMQTRLSPLCRLHSIIAGQSAAEAWARSVEMADFLSKIDPSRGGALGRGLAESMRSVVEEMAVDPAIACFLHFRQRLLEKFSMMSPKVVSKAATRMAMAGACARTELAAPLGEALLAAEGDLKMRRHASQRYEGMGRFVLDTPRGSDMSVILSWRSTNSGGALLFAEACRRMWTDEGDTPEGRLFLFREARAFDNRILLEAFPSGVHDGVSLLLPLPTIAAGLGEDGAVERAMSALRRAARGALGLEAAGDGVPAEVAPGTLKDELLSRGMRRAASRLCSGRMETRLRESGEDIQSVASAIRAACLDVGEAPSERLEAGGAEDLNAALRSAAWHGAYAVARECLENGADPLSASARGLTPMMMAAASGSKEAAALLAPLSDLSALDAGGMSALHHAAAAGSKECCAILGTLAGSAKNHNGKTPEDLARAIGNDELGDWLRRCGQAVDEKMALEKEAAIVGAAEPAKKQRL